MTDASTSHHTTAIDGYLSTPLVRMDRLFPGAAAPIYAKLDSFQVSGSTKERTAYSLLEGLQRDGKLTQGSTIVESTSGNLGISLARQCALRGVAFIAVVDERANVAACQSMRAFGARIELVPTPEDGNRLAARVAKVRELLEHIPGAVTTNQYGNPDNPRVHASSTLPEIVEDLGAAPTHLFIATSTTGTLLGCQQAIERNGWGTKLVAVDAEGSALFGGRSGERRLPGLGAGFATDLSQQVHPDAVFRIPEPDMVLGARLLARREGLLAGASTGANVASIGRALPALGEDDVVVFLVHDGGAPYLPTVYDDAWVASQFGPDAVPGSGVLEQVNPFPAGEPFRGRL